MLMQLCTSSGVPLRLRSGRPQLLRTYENIGNAIFCDSRSHHFLNHCPWGKWSGGKWSGGKWVADLGPRPAQASPVSGQGRPGPGLGFAWAGSLFDVKMITLRIYKKNRPARVLINKQSRTIVKLENKRKIHIFCSNWLKFEQKAYFGVLCPLKK